jgi:hypothetical protein
MKRKVLCTVFILFARIVSIYSETGLNAQGGTNPAAADADITESSASSGSFIHQIDFFLTFEPMFILNTEAGTKSAPSPVVYPLTVGVSWPDYYFVSFQPRLSLFYNYYLWDSDEEMALPAEVENRTATVFSFLFTFPAVFSFHLTDRGTLEAEAGVSMLVRFGILSSGVSSSDSGTSGTAADDTSLINKWFWTNGRMMYLSGGAAWLYSFTDTIKAGPDVRFYLPLGSLAEGRGLDAMMLSAGIKLVL